MVALWAEVQRTGVTGREAHGCPCLRPQTPHPAQKDEWQGNNFSKASVCICVCVCVPPARLAYGLSVGT